ncbi:MAG: hypothetical protein M3301_01460, partial [Chloroflexota bacterium]|nr:hypothetical protein [Chloroflexota bacterium]
MKSSRRLLCALVVAGPLFTLTAPSAADAATCAYNAGTHTVAISMPDSSLNLVRLQRSGTTIRTAESTCSGGPTVNNTDAITITDTSPGQNAPNLVFIDVGSGPFAPGFSDANDTSSEPEIEITVDLKGGNDTLTLLGADTADRFGFASFAGDFANLNVGETGDDDADVSFDGVEDVQVDAKGGHDEIDGGAGSVLDLDRPLLLFGESGNDKVTGGGLDDDLRGGAGND